MTDTATLVDLALNGKPVQFKNEFNDLMKSKVTDVLDKVHAEVNGSNANDDDEFLDMDLELTPEEEAELDTDENI
jgi:hypothetical protein